MSVITVDLPEGVDDEQAEAVIKGALATLASGARLVCLPIPGDTPDDLMPAIAAAGVAATRTVLLNAAFRRQEELDRVGQR